MPIEQTLVADIPLLEIGLSTAPAASATPVAGPIAPAAAFSAPHANAAAQQIATALADPAREAGSPVELALDPPELGRVRLSLTEVSGAMTLTIHAERPETADLMRRHLDLLAQEFARSGLDAPSVRVNTGGPDGGEGRATPGQTGDATGAEPNSENDPTPAPINARAAQGGLDLRL